MERPNHAELRIHAGKTIAEAAQWLRVSHGHLGNAERGLSKLTPAEEADLCAFYLESIRERLARLARAAACIPASAETTKDKS
jgi:hypothetical protein